MRDSRRDSQELLCSSQNCTQKRINFTVWKKTYKLIKIEMLFFFLNIGAPESGHLVLLMCQEASRWHLLRDQLPTRWEGARKDTGEQGLGSRQGACREIHARSKRRSSRTCASPEASPENQGESSGLGGRLTPSLGTLSLGHSKMASQCLLFFPALLEAALYLTDYMCAFFL